MRSTRELLEDAIAANFDDIAAHSAYADLLMEEGDPRGELIQIQLALENESLLADERRRYKKREREWRDQHEREWLGPLAEFLLGRARANVSLAYRRGWLHSLEIQSLGVRFGQALAQAGAARNLQRLIVLEEIGELEGINLHDLPLPLDTQNPGLALLREAKFADSLRSFQFGSTPEDHYEIVDDAPERGRIRYNAFIAYEPPAGPGVAAVVRNWRRLERLLLYGTGIRSEDISELDLPALRVLALYHFHAPAPLDWLAENPAMANLTKLALQPRPEGIAAAGPEGFRELLRSPHLRRIRHLQLRYTDIGDRGMADLVRSGWLRRLRVLDLRHGTVTNRGARSLVEAPDFGNLQRLDLQRNRIRRTGVRLLEDAGDEFGVVVSVEHQQRSEGLGSPDDELFDPEID